MSQGTPGDESMVRAERVELILQQLDSLPTLGAIAIRLLQLTADEDADAQEVIDLVASDPAMAAKVLATCRCHERGRASNVTTVDRAVLLLGFEAVRCAVLSVQVFEVIDKIGKRSKERDRPRLFDREAFWLHALGVAVTSERIARTGSLTGEIRPSEAFMAGLLHDIGQLVLHVMMPESFDQICRVAETHSASLDHACRRILGIDTHTAGKRLAEHWGLPESLVDVIWMNGQPLEALPPSPNRLLTSVVTLADAVVRSRYITPGAHWSRNENLDSLCVPAGLTAEQVDAIASSIHSEVADRAKALGLRDAHDSDVLLRSLCRANESLARANAGMRQRERVAQGQSRMLEAFEQFHRSALSARTEVDALSCIAQSAAKALGAPMPAALFQSAGAEDWRLLRFDADAEPVGTCIVAPPPGAIALETLVHDFSGSAPLEALLPWLDEYLEDVDLEPLRLLPLPGTAPGDHVILVLDAKDSIDTDPDLVRLQPAWRSVLTAGIQHDRSALLAERLAEANRTVIDTRDAIARSRTLTTLGQVASGAAHEMNNPLTVISGRAQMLGGRLEGEERDMAREIVAQAHRISDMITALRSFAEPLEPIVKPIDFADLVMRVVQQHGASERRQVQVNTIFSEPLPDVCIDPKLISGAIGELLRNAVEAKGARHIELRVQTDPIDDRLKIEVRDDGEGLVGHVLEHAFDPFFSEKPAGRQPGLGLARARRFVEAHGGKIALANAPGRGAVATIWLKDWRGDDGEPKQNEPGQPGSRAA